MSSAETFTDAALSAPERSILAGIARAAIARVVAGERYRLPEALPPRLLEAGASFVSLHRAGELRGCLGTIEPHRPLAEDVAVNARAAASRDPRFPPVAAGELDDLEIEVSILSPLTLLDVDSEAALLAVLRPGVDGLLLEDGFRRATFLPAVWATLATPREFVTQLKRKAGLPPDHWSSSMRCFRYVVEEIRSAPAAR
jgi:AmmeMemoRadiSam system protein A